MKKGTLIVLGAFVALLVAVFVTREERVSVGVRKLELQNLDKAKVTAVELSGAREAKLTRSGEGWQVADPKKPEATFAADGALVEAAVDSINELKSPEFLTDRKERHAEYEVDDSKGLKLQVTQEGGKPLALIIGKAAKSGGSYVRAAGSDEVFVAKGRLEWTVKKDLKGWRKKALLAVKAEDVAKLTLRPAEGEAVTLVAGAAGEPWKLAEGTVTPPGYRFDPQAAQQLVQQLVGATAQDFVEGDGGTAFSQPHSVLELELKDGQKRAVHLGPVPEGTDAAAGVLAKVEGDAQVYSLPQYTAKSLRKDLGDLRDLSLFSFDPAKVTRIKLMAGGKPVVVGKEGESWKVVEPKKLPEGFEFEPSTVTSQLGWLRSVKAARLWEQKVPDAQAGLGAPSALVEVSVEGAPAQTLRLGKEAPAQATGGKELYGKGAVDGFLYAVPEYVRGRLAQGVELFKKPTPPPSFGGPNAIRGLEQLPPEVRKQLEAQLRAQGMR